VSILKRLATQISGLRRGFEMAYNKFSRMSSTCLPISNMYMPVFISLRVLPLQTEALVRNLSEFARFHGSDEGCNLSFSIQMYGFVDFSRVRQI
jgi:hypothetical protein